MPFKGTLDTLSMIEVFQVISMTGKAGCLAVSHPDGETKRLYFEAGAIVAATSTCAKDRLGAVLVKMGLLSQQQVEASRQNEQRTGRKQGQTLVEQGLLDEQALNDALIRQVAETSYSVIGWREGTFEFLDDERPGRDVFRVHESVTNLVMQGTRQLDEWRLIEQTFPDLDVVLALSTHRSGSGDIHLQPDDWQLLTSVDGHRSLRDICALSRLSNFEVCKRLLGLHGAGLVVTAAHPPAAIEGAVHPEAPRIREAPPPPPAARIVADPPFPTPMAARVVSARFEATVRQHFTRHVGPMAEVILEEVSETLRVDIDRLPLTRVPELARLLCAEIDSPDKRELFHDLVLRAAED